MNVPELIKVLETMPQDASVALRSVLPNQRVRWDDIDRVEKRAYDDLPPIVLIR
jgi:hypothetical protein